MCVVRCSLPSDPPVGGHSCNGGMIPRFHRVVCHYFTLWNTAGADCTVKSESRSRLPVLQKQSGVSPSALVILHESVRDSDLINVRFGPLCGLKSDISRGPRSAITGCEQSQQSGLYSITSL